MEAAFPTGTFPMSAVAVNHPTVAPGRPPVSHRLVHHALSVVAAGLEVDAAPSFAAGYNPVVLVGPADSGKSRLLAEWFLQHSRDGDVKRTRKAVVMWDGRSLDRELVSALSHNTIDRLHERFVSSRLIIIDAVEQITAWDAQRALAHLVASRPRARGTR
jgi:chromosomal replication initiation ATPase DnaA